MRFCLVFLSFFLISTVFPPDAHAVRQKGIWGWLSDDFNPENFNDPYLRDGQTPHAYQWDFGDWNPQDWIDARGSAESVIKDLYKAQIISEQSEEDNIPILEVGQAFLNLSSEDQSKIVYFFDYVYGITYRDPAAVIHLEHEDTNKRIGLYTAQGLQLQ